MANTPDTTQRIINVTARTLEIAPSTIAATSTWTDDLGADSLAQAEILMNLEEEFQCVIRDEEAGFMPTVGDLAAYIETRLPK